MSSTDPEVVPSPDPVSSSSVSPSLEDSVDTAVVHAKAATPNPTLFSSHPIKSIVDVTAIVDVPAAAATATRQRSHSKPGNDTAAVKSEHAKPTVASSSLDLLLGWRKIQTDSRYAFTAPSSQSILEYLANVRHGGGGADALGSIGSPASTLSTTISMISSADSDDGKPECEPTSTNLGNSSSLTTDQRRLLSSSSAAASPIASVQQQPMSPDHITVVPSSISSAGYGDTNSGIHQLKLSSSAPTSPDPSFIGSGDGGGSSFQGVDLNDIFGDLQSRFGFQLDAVRNTLEYMRSMLDSRTSRMSSSRALSSLFE
jgi:hypothetical protein